MENTESRAFGLLTEKTLDKFYISSTLTCRAELGSFAINECLKIKDPEINIHEPIINLIPSQYVKRIEQRKERKTIEINYQLLVDYNQVVNILNSETINFQRKKGLSKKYPIGIYPEINLEELNKDNINEKVFNNNFIDIPVRIQLQPVFNKLVKRCRKINDQCPNILGVNPSKIIKASSLLTELDNFIKDSVTEFGAELVYFGTDPVEPKRFKVDEPRNVFNLGKLILLEGPPGCGKTTFTKMLTIQLLNDNVPVLFVPCYRIPSEFNHSKLENIASKFAITKLDDHIESKKTVLILDGLDECSFNISKKLDSAANKFKNVIASTRTSYLDKINAKYFCMSIVPFTPDERDSFLENWLINKSEILSSAREIILNHKDVDLHTRLPLIGTIFVALLENGYNPRTRLEIYEKRLELLLSRWDKAKGVNRIRINNPTAKIRFLMRLAFKLHSYGYRRRSATREELIDTYEESLGSWGYEINANELIDELVNANGVLVKSEGNRYSFGHLTFQEHLVGEYLNTFCRIVQIADYMGDDWWKEPLNFYSSKKGSLDELILHLQKSAAFGAYVSQLKEMLLYAPYTSPGARDCVLDLDVNQ